MSYDQRAIFFEECLKAQDPATLHRKMVAQSSRLEMIRRNVEAYSRDFSAARVAGGSQVVGGSILMGLGVAIPPLAPITSPLGMALTIIGSGTSMVSTLLGGHWTEEQGARAGADMRKLNEDYRSFATLIGLYQQAVIQIHLKPENNKILKSTEEKVQTALLQSSPILAECRSYYRSFEKVCGVIICAWSWESDWNCREACDAGSQCSNRHLGHSSRSR